MKEFYNLIKITFSPFIEKWKPSFYFYYWHVWKRLTFRHFFWLFTYYDTLLWFRYKKIRNYFRHEYNNPAIYYKWLNEFKEDPVDTIYFFIYNILNFIWKKILYPILKKILKYLYKFFIGLIKLLFLRFIIRVIWYLLKKLFKISIILTPVLIFGIKRLMPWIWSKCLSALENLVDLIIYAYGYLQEIYLINKPDIIKILKYLKIIFKKFIIKIINWEYNYELKTNIDNFIIIIKPIFTKIINILFLYKNKFIIFWKPFIKNVFIYLYIKIKLKKKNLNINLKKIKLISKLKKKLNITLKKIRQFNLFLSINKLENFRIYKIKYFIKKLFNELKKINIEILTYLNKNFYK